MSNKTIIQIVVVTPDGRILARRPVQREFAGMSSAVRRNGLPWQVSITRTKTAMENALNSTIINSELNFYFNRNVRDIGILKLEYQGMLDRELYSIYSLAMTNTTHLQTKKNSETRLLSFDEIKDEMSMSNQNKYVHHSIIAFNQLLMVKRRRNYAGPIR